MTRKSYARTLDIALRPLGFERAGMDWVRVRGNMWECVNLQASWLGGVTVNLFIKDLETEKLYLEAIQDPEAIQMPPEDIRIGHLIDGRDRWWEKSDDPDDLTDKVLACGLPWFDLVRTLEEQAQHWFLRDNPEAWHASRLIKLAITLYRMGHLEEACEALATTPPKLALPLHVAKVARVRRWMNCEGAADS